MAEKLYYGIEKEEGDEYAGDYLCYAYACNGVNGEIGIKKKGVIPVYFSEMPEMRKGYLIFHAMIPATDEFEESIQGHLIRGAKEISNIGDIDD